MTGYLDIGNSDIKCAIDSPWQEIARFSTADLSLSLLNKELAQPLTKLVVASVVPRVNKLIQTWASEKNIELRFISNHQEVVRIATDNPEEVGADLIAAAAAVVGDCLVVDAGTATTVSFIRDSVLTGVAIAPGPRTQMNSLVSSASQLQESVLQPTKSYFGTSTPSALGSGIVQGQVAWIEHLAMKYPECTLILTGGYGSLLSSSMTMGHVYDPFVVYKGLQVIDNGIT